MQAPGEILVQQHGYVYSRRALLLAPMNDHRGAIQAVTAGQGDATAVSSFDANVVMILAVLLCALICALGVNSIVRCALQCSTRMPLPPAVGAGGVAAQAAVVRRKALRAMPTLVLQAAGSACAICLADMEPGERVRVLPKCSHGFHVRCVDRWLMARSTCPTCRQPLFGEPQKTKGCAAPVRSTTTSYLVPLRPEGLVTPYDF